MALWTFIYHVVFIILWSINMAGFFLLWDKSRGRLHICLALASLCILVDFCVEFVGAVIPSLAYHRVVSIPASWPVALFKESISVVSFYLIRQITTALLRRGVSRGESVCWAVLGAFVLIVTAIPALQTGSTFLLIFLIYTFEALFAWGSTAVALYQKREQYAKSFYGFWMVLSIASILCYLLGSFVENDGMGSIHPRNLFTVVLWDGYALCAQAYLWRTFLLARKRTDKLKLYRVKERFALTEREFQVFCLLLEGKSNNEISEELHIALGTVKTHTYNIFQKTGVNKRAQLAALVSEPRETL